MYNVHANFFGHVGTSTNVQKNVQKYDTLKQIS